MHDTALVARHQLHPSFSSTRLSNVSLRIFRVGKICMSTLHKDESESTVNNVNKRYIQLVRVVTYFEVEVGAHDTHERNSKLQPAPPHARTPVRGQYCTTSIDDQVTLPQHLIRRPHETPSQTLCWLGCCGDDSPLFRSASFPATTSSAVSPLP